ncbi:MAG: ComE operon protein 2 [Candidatus Falkowbacteria bacterium GW2011_GWC2_38_22]|uniref:ComE operon protein 2 n=1 Tax=Candidatus Falkowbacteria bacterium GW2011_GWE1_38_31 TaxID=1618638 RepID=A0A0G0M7T3_9BACT|nr:MAG: ComE operon protein 2 [Candidatus Falkowbacteria bacterium GW2011_GWF2_38_1205]KKQ60801.1 MAG: ComE operon protein 2 [Candidatus Falkowbacteria bacterium GW2011_GWC2_38_22]KKQ62968.1 MAG: ComE operon protein 2 [Candidatus Falkowbacteria bacterium GW2011_GWF1_38_22]KKQ64980.1 MAG: ComE operon protein 2 [Candidatus Falkowbacteria bacterium GW2011_GWE2_38_254]KKQ69744.1 MAG: ComE operon protein 2 [Candidatus Falkowbacteria bacterium GW2011_GWE1_38_31]KKQ72352.1 MAG: ComE operon protein 2 
MGKLDHPKIKRLSWDEMLMNLSIISSKRTACKFHETGAVFVDKDKRILSIGYNGPTAGDYHCIDHGCAKVDGDPVTKKLRRCRGAHAEINGIINCQDAKRMKGATLYSVLFPCYDCMKALSNAGIAEIVYYKKYERIQTGGENFEEEDESLELAQKRNIIIRKYEGKIFCNFPDEYNTEQTEHGCCDCQ